MSEDKNKLQEMLDDILQDKNSNLTPNNLRKGVTCLGIQGALQEGVDTSDATATNEDIEEGKTAYVNGQKITGNVKSTWYIEPENTEVVNLDLNEENSSVDVRVGGNSTKKFIFNPDNTSGNIALTGEVPYLDLANTINLTSDKIMKGNNILGIEGSGEGGIDTSDATATADDIISPKTAYVNGEKIEGGIIPEYDTSGINTDNIIINNTNLGIFDIRYDINYALVGNKGGNSFYICTIKNNTISLEDSVQLSVTDINNTQPFVVSDVKFNIGAPANDIINIYGCSTYGQAHKYDGANFTDVFKIKLNIQNNTYEIQDKVITTSPTKGNFDLSGLIFSHIYIMDTDTFLLKPEIYNIVYGTSAIVLPRMIFNNLTLISSLDYGVDGWNTVTTNAYVSRNLFIEYNNDKYRIYNIDNDFNFVKLDDNTDNSTNRVSLVNNSYYLKGCKLYNTNASEVKDYTNIISNNNYKQYIDGYIYEFNVNNHSVSIYEFNKETLNLTPLKVLENRINSYEMGSSNILTLPSYSYNDYICYGINSENTVYCDILETSNVIKSLTRQNKTYFDIENTTVIESDMLIGKVGYNKTGKIIGTMPNNGELNVTSTEETQTFDAGYYSNITVNSVSFEESQEYQECLTITEEILS